MHPPRNLLERLTLQQNPVLAFRDDLALPCDNNHVERDVRGRKIQHKVSGGFRSDWGADAYATIRGYLATLRKQGQSHLAPAPRSLPVRSSIQSLPDLLRLALHAGSVPHPTYLVERRLNLLCLLTHSSAQ
jgi:hypothetical protein